MRSCLSPTIWKKEAKSPKRTKQGNFFRFWICSIIFCAVLTLAGLPNSAWLGAQNLDAQKIATSFDFSESTKSELYPIALVKNLDRIQKSRVSAVQVLAKDCLKIRQTIQATVFYMEQGDAKNSQIEIEKLRDATIRWTELRSHCSWEDVNVDLRGIDKAKGVDEESLFVPSGVLLEEIQLALERRVILWQLALQAQCVSTIPLSTLFVKKIDDLQRLRQRTEEVENFFLGKQNEYRNTETVGPLWCKYLETETFLTELEACQNDLTRPNRRVSYTATPHGESEIPVSMLVSFSDRANLILSRINDPELTPKQIEYLSEPAVVAWRQELKSWSTDTVQTAMLLRDMEKYENSAGMTDMEVFQRTAKRISVTPTPALRQLGQMTLDLYGGSNVKIYVSKILVNHLLPPSAPEVAAFREVIQGQQVYGKRQTSTDIEMNFLPHDERLLLSLDVKGSVSTSSRSFAFATTLFNRGQAQYSARKMIELTEEGFMLSPSKVQVTNNRLELRNFQTEFDRVPILSGLVRGVVRNQYEAREGGAREETKHKIARQVRNRVDKEADERFSVFNERYRAFMLESLARFDLFLEKKNALTEEHWLLTSWTVKSRNSLSGHTPAPETPAGSFADVKIHESAVNTFLSRLEFAGHQMTVGEFKERIAEKFQRPEWAEPEENDNVEIGFAAVNPVSVRFTEGGIDIAISIDSLKVQRQTHRNFKVFVRYQPALTPEGRLVLQRDGVVSIDAAKVPLVLRAVFSKIFAANRAIPLSPALLETDDRFHNLTTGHCRIEKGWFAIALISEENLPTLVGSAE